MRKTGWKEWINSTGIERKYLINSIINHVPTRVKNYIDV